MLNQRNVGGLAKPPKQRAPGRSRRGRSVAEGSWHSVRKDTGKFSCCFCVSLALGTQVSATAPHSVPGLSCMLTSGPWRDPDVPWDPDVQCGCPWFGNRQLQAAMSWLNWAWWGWNLGCMDKFRFPGRQSQEELRIGPQLLLLRTSLLPGLAFVHIVLQLQNTDLSSVRANKQKIFTVLL